MPQENNVVSNKLAVIHVLAALMNNPLLFYNDNYKFSRDDFPEPFHQYLFDAIAQLAENGIEKIDYIDVDQLLANNYKYKHEVFVANRGNEYIQNALAIYDEKKFDYYYQTLKKFSLINCLNKNKIDTSDIYNPDIIDPIESAKQAQAFNDMTVNDILDKVETKIINIQDIYSTNSDRVEGHAGKNLRELKEGFKQIPEMGLKFVSPTLTGIARGQRRGCLFLESAPSGYGKSRVANSEACHLAVPTYYDVVKQKWVDTHMEPQSVLVISTELEENECQQMWMAFIAGVSEMHIKNGQYLPGEEERVDKAIELLEQSKLYFVSITNYDVDDITNIIKKYHHDSKKQVNYVFFDYLGETLKITSSIARKTRIQGLRTDQILLMFASALKDLAKTLGIYIWTASQLSGDYKGAKDLDASYLRSAKSLADKVDVGCILMPVREIDKPIIDNLINVSGFRDEVKDENGKSNRDPNFVLNIYKIRAGSFQNIKLYGYFDRSVCQWTDCMIPDETNPKKSYPLIIDNSGAFIKVEIQDGENSYQKIIDSIKTEEVEEDQDSYQKNIDSIKTEKVEEDQDIADLASFENDGGNN